MHTRAQDDTHTPARTHLGSCVLPATLAVAQRDGCDGTAVITAAVAGCEVAAAVGERLAAAAIARGFRGTPVFGTLGAAAAASSLLGLTEEATVNAIAIAAGSFSGGLNQTWIDGTTEYRIHPGIAARNGVLAADLAAAGFTGAAHWYEGDAGFAGAFADGDPQPGQAWMLGERWRLLDVTYKPYPVCAITQSSVRVAIDLATEHDLDVADVARVSVYLNPADHRYPGTVNPGPYRDIAASLMSTEFCVAMALSSRQATLEGLRRLEDPAILRLVGLTDVNADEGILSLGGRVTIELASGQRIEGELMPDASTYGWDWDGVVDNAFQMQPEMAISRDQLAAVIEMITTLAPADDVVELVASTVA